MRPQIKKFYKTDHPKSGNSDSKYFFKIFKNKKSNSEKTPQSSKKSKTYISRPQIKKFCKIEPPKVGILIKNTILKFSKTKNQTKKRPFKIPQNQKHKNFFYKIDPTKRKNSDSKYSFKIF